MKHIVQLIIVLSILSACGTSTSRQTDSADRSYETGYAAGFDIYAYGSQGSTIIDVRNPWQGAEEVTMRIFVSRGGEAAPEGFDGTVVSAPIRKVVCMSSTYVAFLDALGSVDIIKGVSGARYITNDTIRRRYSRGTVHDVGNDSNLNFELLASLEPDLVLVYGVAGESSVVSGKMQEMNIPVAYIGEYLETSPLGKAEWIVLFGELTDKRAQAEKLFSEIASQYETDKLAVSGKNLTRPTVMLNAPYRDTWFMPGTDNYMVHLLEDAGGLYANATAHSNQSRPVSGEAAFVMASKTDYWLNPNEAGSLAELTSVNPRFKDIPAVRNHRVYNNTRRNTPDGGSDFWESGAVYPNIILRDLIRIFHPGLLPTHELYYYKRLE